jgi:hypothetical protein
MGASGYPLWYALFHCFEAEKRRCCEIQLSSEHLNAVLALCIGSPLFYRRGIATSPGAPGTAAMSSSNLCLPYPLWSMLCILVLVLNLASCCS